MYLQGQLEAIDTDNGLFTVAWSTGLGCEFDVSVAFLLFRLSDVLTCGINKNATSLLFNPSGALLGAGIHCGQAMQNCSFALPLAQACLDC